MMPFITRKRHEAEMAAKDADLSYWQGRALRAGVMSNELLRERDEARAVLATAYVRGPKGHFQRATLPTPPETTA